jgi:hypothetical protein
MVLNVDKSEANDPRPSFSFTKKNFVELIINIKNETISKLISFEGLTIDNDDNQRPKNILNWNIFTSLIKVRSKIKADLINQKANIIRK